MIIENIIKVKVSNRTKRYFLQKGYLDNNGYFFVRPEDMNDTNRTKVACKCDYCGDIRNVMWSNYLIQINKTSDKIYSCHKCHFNKTKMLFREKYGTENIQVLEEIKNKIRITCLKKYGIGYPSGSKEAREKMKKTLIDRYGVDHPMKNEDIFNKAQKSSYKHIRYNGTNLHYQGKYELDFIEYCMNNNIDIKNGPTIKYIYLKKDRRYFSDFIINSKNLIVEIKSTYTFDDDRDENLAKKEYSIKSGYNFIFIIDKNYDELESILKS